MASTSASQAGLELGFRCMGMAISIAGFNPEDWFADARPEMARYASEAAEHLTLDIRLEPESFVNTNAYIGERYGVPTKECLEAIKLVARTEGVLLDPVYTGKAMAGLIDHVRKGELTNGDEVIFVHTGGNPALFAYSEDFGDLTEHLTK